MKIIAKTPSENGAYPPIQDWPGLVPPDGYYQWPTNLSPEDFYDYNGFVTLDVTRNMVVAYHSNAEAWEAWKAENQGKEPEPTETQLLGQEITALHLDQIEQGQMMTELQLGQMEGGKADA